MKELRRGHAWTAVFAAVVILAGCQSGGGGGGGGGGTGAPVGGQEGLVTLSAPEVDAGEGAATYRWTQVEGPPVELSDPTVRNPSFPAPEVEEATVLRFEVDVTSSGTTLTFDVVVNIEPSGEGVENDPPAIDVAPSQEVAIGDPVTLDASGSTDPDGDELSFEWAQVFPAGADATAEMSLADAQTAAASFTADSLGVFFFTVEVSDGQYTISAVTSVTVSESVGEVADATATTLASGTATGGEVEAESFSYYRVDVPANATQLVITVEADESIDLYIRRDALPTTENFDLTSTESEVILNAATNPELVPLSTYYIGVLGGRAEITTFVITATNTIPPARTVILHVDASAPASGDGTSWTKAYNTLQDAILNSLDRDNDLIEDNQVAEIWVAQGTYRPDQGGGNAEGDRAAYFRLLSGVGLYGGFTGDETARDQRNSDPATNGTILSGDLLGNDESGDEEIEDDDPDRADNSSLVLRVELTDPPAGPQTVLDGFTITGGNAAGGSSYDGGGIIIEPSGPVISNCIFADNTASDDGGAVYNGSARPTFTNCVFRRNVASSEGGAVMIVGGSYPTFTDCLFEDNASIQGGGAVLSGGDGAVTFLQCAFQSNNCTTVGGGIQLHGTGWLTDCAFDNNTASDGGALSVFSGDCTLVNCSFTGNSASSAGGGIRVSSYRVTLVDCLFTGNSAGGEGGGVNLDAADAELTGCSFSNNEAGRAGGGLRVADSNATVLACSFAHNTAERQGGALANWSKSGLINCALVDNNAEQGGAVYNDFGPLTMTNCTIAGNTATIGGGAMWNDHDLTMTNSILWGNSAPDGTQIYYESGDEPEVTFSCIQAGLIGTGNISSDPLFVRNAGEGDSGDLRLRDGSPAINAGNNDADTNIGDEDDEGEVQPLPDTDLDGNPRIVNGTVDLGAYEAQ